MGQRKSSYVEAAERARGVGAGYSQLGKDIGGFRTGQLQPQRERLETIRQGPRPDLEAARGYYGGVLQSGGRWSPETVRGMYSAQTEAGAGGRTAFMKEMNRNLRAGGMGATGAGIRNLQTYDEGLEGRNRGALRDINVANETQARAAMQAAAAGSAGLQSMEDTWNLNNLTQQANVLGMEQGSYGQQGQAYGGQLSAMAPEMEAYEGAYRPGFWGQLGSSVARGVGQGVAGMISGGASGAGYALGQRSLGQKPKVTYGQPTGNYEHDYYNYPISRTG